MKEHRPRCQCLCDCSHRPAKGNRWRCASHCGALVCQSCVATVEPLICHWCLNPDWQRPLIGAEYTALVGLNRRFGTPWRPMEQGLVEGAHKETQKIMGIMVKDVMQCFPNETGELQYVIEFVVYNTPGPHGLTPRDIDRRWSLATPLE